MQIISSELGAAPPYTASLCNCCGQKALLECRCSRIRCLRTQDPPAPQSSQFLEKPAPPSQVIGPHESEAVTTGKVKAERGEVPPFGLGKENRQVRKRTFAVLGLLAGLFFLSKYRLLLFQELLYDFRCRTIVNRQRDFARVLIK